MLLLNDFIEESLSYSNVTDDLDINIDLINDGFSQDENFIFEREGGLIKVFDRVCDHAGGRLFLKGSKAVCPLHGWQLDIHANSYIDPRCDKQPLLVINEHELDSPLVHQPSINNVLNLLPYTKNESVEVTFINHACMVFNVDDKFSFATDPWVIGSAFSNGWWLLEKSPADVFDTLNKCDFIYISHNHPDHLHPLSLSHIRKDMPILTADFDSGSTVKLLEKAGFENIIKMQFSTRLSDHENELSFSVLKSGDFRDDSGLLVEIGKFKCLLTVDSNFLNFGNLPQNIDLLCSSFAGGASGFPLCFETYTEEEKKKILSRNVGAIRATNIKNIEMTNAQFFLPYAGFFTEGAARDRYIKERNIKNSVEDYQKICDKKSCGLLNVTEFQVYTFKGKKLVSSTAARKANFKELSVEEYIRQTEQLNQTVTDELIEKYFINSGFNDDLVLDLLCTNDDFDQDYNRFIVDFSMARPKIVTALSVGEHLEAACIDSGKRYLRIRVRKSEFFDLIRNGRPWEDLSIGFQCRIYRNPNIYNSAFWFHFTNKYVS